MLLCLDKNKVQHPFKVLNLPESACQTLISGKTLILPRCTGRRYTWQAEWNDLRWFKSFLTALNCLSEKIGEELPQADYGIS